MTRSTSELERLRCAFTHGPDATSPDSLPVADRIWDAVRGEAEPDEIIALADIAAASPEFAHEWRLARELTQAATNVESISRWRSYRAPLLAVAAVLVMAMVPLLWRQAPGNPPVYRGGDLVEIRSEVGQGKAVSRNDCVLRWTNMGDEVAYTVTVMTADLEVVVKKEDLRSAQLRIPADELGESGPILWRVEAMFRDGRVVASETFVVRVE